jgi:hypothetical protein
VKQVFKLVKGSWEDVKTSGLQHRRRESELGRTQSVIDIIFLVNDPSFRMQWDPGIIPATAWGQAVFRGAGNVMTWRRAERSPMTEAKPSQYRSYTRLFSDGRRYTKTYSKQSRVHPLSSSDPLGGVIRFSRSLVCSAATP